MSFILGLTKKKKSRNGFRAFCILSALELKMQALANLVSFSIQNCGPCFPEASKALELHFANYLDIIVDNREDNDFLVEENSTRGVVLQGFRGDVPNEVDEEFRIQTIICPMKMMI
ncbi:hypothetical protein H5410_040448 [Solanum commersonii]|uniref:Uncharacterized protein n=1 Tax=Solanum commersonii TaxID=4109 RepID=A0A9J5XSJ2_SOLCO|nr:hypothetical protein H5410_040448 [Solanum commersonii]